MNKRSIDKIAAEKFIIESRAIQKTDQEIYNELSQKYFDKKSIALLIIATVTEENKAKYKTLNNILHAFIIGAILFGAYQLLQISIQKGSFWGILYICGLISFFSYFIFRISRYTVTYYNFGGTMTILFLMQTFDRTDSWTIRIIIIILASIIAGLCFYLYRNMFPDYRPYHLKVDQNGDFIFNKNNQLISNIES